MQSALQGRGQIGAWRVGNVALAQFGAPAEDKTGTIVAADARIDNASELASQLGMAGKPTSAALIAAAYHRWGEDCPRHLLGEFAFAVWDRREQTLFCARDQFGVRPFFYHLSDALFVAATTARAVHAYGGVPTTIDDAAVAEFVSGTIDDPEATFFSSIRRLPPASSLTVTSDSVRERRYWKLDEIEPLHISDKDAGERFASIFHEAVRCRTADQPAATGVLLSGGMDSSSIAATAARQARVAGSPPLVSLSMTFDSYPQWNEGPFIQAVLGQGGLEPVYLPSEERDFAADLSAFVDEQDWPEPAYNASVSRELFLAAHQAGVRVLLDGHGGDEVISHGQGRLNELAQQRRWRTMWREARGIAAIRAESTWSIAAPYFSHNVTVRRLRHHAARIARLFNRPTEGEEPDLVSADLSARVGLEERLRRATRPRYARDTERDLHLATLANPIHSRAFEVLDKTAAAAGVVPSYPMYDRRLVELCVALPSSAKLRDGLPRRVLRDAMVGVLPEQVRLRPDKYDFTAPMAANMARAVPVMRETLAGQRDIGRFLNVSVANAALNRLAAAGSVAAPQDMQIAWRTHALALWLARRPA